MVTYKKVPLVGAGLRCLSQFGFVLMANVYDFPLHFVSKVEIKEEVKIRVQ